MHFFFSELFTPLRIVPRPGETIHARKEEEIDNAEKLLRYCGSTATVQTGEENVVTEKDETTRGSDASDQQGRNQECTNVENTWVTIPECEDLIAECDDLWRRL